MAIGRIDPNARSEVPRLILGGSGTGVAPRWVLTAAHVVADKTTEMLRVRWIGHEGTGAQVVRVVCAPDGLADVALLEVEPGYLPDHLDARILLRDLPLQRHLTWVVTGYPSFGRPIPTDKPETIQGHGFTGDTESGQLQLVTMRGFGPTGPASVNNWGGVSGAGVRDDDDAIVGVVTEARHDSAYDGPGLWAVPVRHFCYERWFCAALEVDPFLGEALENTGWRSNIPQWGERPWVGRATDLAWLDRTFPTRRKKGKRREVLAVLTGAPTLGKSGLATWFGLASLERYPGGCFQISGRSGSLEQGVLQLARDATAREDISSINVAYAALSARGRSLIIFDDIASPDLFGAEERSLLPPARSGIDVLITSNHRSWGPRFREREIRALSDDEAGQLFRELVGPQGADIEARPFVKRCQGDLVQLTTLALAIAEQRRFSDGPVRLDEILEDCKSQDQPSFEHSWALLSSEGRERMSIAAVLSAAGFSPRLVDELSCREHCLSGFVQLWRLGLLDRVSNGQLRVHPSLARWVRGRQAPVPAVRRRVLRRCYGGLLIGPSTDLVVRGMLIGDPDWHGPELLEQARRESLLLGCVVLVPVTGLLMSLFPPTVITAVFVAILGAIIANSVSMVLRVGQLLRLYRTVQGFLELGEYDRAVEWANHVEGLSDSFLAEGAVSATTRANLTGTIGQYLYRAGQYAQAVRWFDRSVEHAGEGGQWALIALEASLAHLGMCFFHLGDFRRALDILRQASRLHESAFALRLLWRFPFRRGATIEGRVAVALDLVERSLAERRAE